MTDEILFLVKHGFQLSRYWLFRDGIDVHAIPGVVHASADAYLARRQPPRVFINSPDFSEQAQFAAGGDPLGSRIEFGKAELQSWLRSGVIYAVDDGFAHMCMPVYVVSNSNKHRLIFDARVLNMFLDPGPGVTS